jgi:AraC-like DNA-binding protein
MTHQHYIPDFPLNEFIAGFTYYKGFQPEHRIDRYLPNGNIEIIIDLTDTPKYIFDNDSLMEIQACKRVWISGMRSEYITIPSGLDAEMFIIEFKKGMAHSFLGRPLTEITGKVVDGDLILDKAFIELREQLLGSRCAKERFAMAEKTLQSAFAGRLCVNPFIDFAIGKIVTMPSALTIKSIADKTGFSSKHFIKIFSDHVGVPPKLFLRIIRFQRAIREIEIKGTIHWASLAYECGYYDQAHFIADFRGFSGFTPQQYMQRKNGTINYIPVG